jgi:hypothetical protein
MGTAMMVMNVPVAGTNDVIRVTVDTTENAVQSSQIIRGGNGMGLRKATMKEKHDAASGLWLLWLCASLLAYPILFVACGYDHRFGQPPYGMWAFTALWTLVGVALTLRTISTRWRMPTATGHAAKAAE